MPSQAEATYERSSPAALRNREPIAQSLAGILPQQGRVLMVAEGSGEHAVHFARSFPALTWLPTDPDPAALASIASYRDRAQLDNLAPPLPLDAAAEDWPVKAADAIVCINMVHISPWAATCGLLDGAARILPPGGILYLYGPYLQEGVATAPSNLAFDASLKARNPQWGLRRLKDIVGQARDRSLSHAETCEMPANNLSVWFQLTA